VFDFIKNFIEQRGTNETLIFLDAPGWTDKIVTLNVLVSWIRMQDKEVATSTTSGIAATLLYSGQISHDRFKLSFDPRNDSVCDVRVIWFSKISDKDGAWHYWWRFNDKQAMLWGTW
jgi:hypothetical protein